MDALYLTGPSLAWEEQVMAYRRESLAKDAHMNGVGGLDRCHSMPQWLAMLARSEREDSCGPGLVPATTLLCVRRADERLVGMVNIRHRLNDWLLNYVGHIGYSIRPDERGKGYGKEQLRLALAVCRERGLRRVLLTCDEGNRRSRRVIEACGGLYEDSRVKPGEGGAALRRYWIDLG